MDLVMFGSYLKEKRKAKGLTLVQLAEQVGVSHPYLSQIENGKKSSPPSSDVLIRLAFPLGVPYEELLSKTGYLIEPSEIDDIVEGVENNGVSSNIDFEKLKLLTSDQFVNFIISRLPLDTENTQIETIPHDEFDEIKKPQVKVYIKRPGQLITFFYNAQNEKYSLDILSEYEVLKYMELSKGVKLR